VRGEVGRAAKHIKEILFIFGAQPEAINPYGDGHAAARIVEIIRRLA
jgi:hypothetical protein